MATKKLTVNKAVLSEISKFELTDKSKVQKTAMKVIKDYKKKFGKERKEGLSKKKALENATNKNKLLINRVQNSIVQEVAKDLEENYAGEKFIWLPSDANEPDPLHQLNYGKIFIVGQHDYEGREIGTNGCKCGMEILTDNVDLVI